VCLGVLLLVRCCGCGCLGLFVCLGVVIRALIVSRLIALFVYCGVVLVLCGGFAL